MELAAPSGNTSSSGQNNNGVSPAFEVGAATHETKESETATGFPSIVETLSQGEIETPPPTRRTFMASWPSANG
ncbi:MAG TPA: hypothetical protein VE867_00190, partial [Candidatus Binatia bacterium]|nr:hypothetical protein [Candidatus Binatia bacterium]